MLGKVGTNPSCFFVVVDGVLGLWVFVKWVKHVENIYIYILAHFFFFKLLILMRSSPGCRRDLKKAIGSLSGDERRRVNGGLAKKI